MYFQYFLHDTVGRVRLQGHYLKEVGCAFSPLIFTLLNNNRRQNFDFLTYKTIDIPIKIIPIYNIVIE